MTDYYSEWFEVAYLNAGTTASKINAELMRKFAIHGIPDRMISDNGPPYSSREFADFMDKMNIEHITMSPLHSQTNGLAEKSVQTAKKLMRKAEETKTNVHLMLLNLRNTPTESGSPAQRQLGRRTRTTIPTTEDKLDQDPIPKATVIQNKSKERRRAKAYYDKNAKDLVPIEEGDNLRYRHKHKWEPAKLTGTPNRSDPRSYTIQNKQGTTLKRN